MRLHFVALCLCVNVNANDEFVNAVLKVFEDTPANSGLAYKMKYSVANSYYEAYFKLADQNRNSRVDIEEMGALYARLAKDSLAESDNRKEAITDIEAFFKQVASSSTNSMNKLMFKQFVNRLHVAFGQVYNTNGVETKTTLRRKISALCQAIASNILLYPSSAMRSMKNTDEEQIMVQAVTSLKMVPEVNNAIYRKRNIGGFNLYAQPRLRRKNQRKIVAETCSPRIRSSSSPTKQIAEHKTCDVEKYFNPIITNNQCGEPERDCFDISDRFLNRGEFNWMKIEDGEFDTCTDKCVGFHDDTLNGGKPLYLCDIKLDDETPQFYSSKNYVGFTIGAVRSRDNVWHDDNNVYTFRHGKTGKMVTITPGLTIFRESGYLQREYVDSIVPTIKGCTFHEAALLDFFGMDTVEIVDSGLYVIAFGNSYQAKHHSTGDMLCDYVFSSSTWNRGKLFESLERRSLVTDLVDHGNARELQKKLAHFFRLAFNIMRATGERTIPTQKLIAFDVYFEKEAKTFLPSCPKNKLR